MRILLAFATGLTILATAAPAMAQGTEKGAFGIGLIIGEPTGVSAKLYLSDDQAVDAAVGGAIVSRGIHVHADYLWHPWILDTQDSFVLPAYIGLGARVLLHQRGRGENDDVHLGIRGVAGLLFDFREIPLDVFIEGAPILDFRTGDDISDHGGLGLGINLAAGARYYF